MEKWWSLVKDARLALVAERLNIADDLHKGIAQQLTHLRLELSQVPEAKQLEAVAAEALHDVRRLIYVLNGLATPTHLYGRIAAIVGDLGDVRPKDIVYLTSVEEEEVLAFVRTNVEQAFASGASSCDVDIDGGIGWVTVRISTDLVADADHILTIAHQEGAA